MIKAKKVKAKHKNLIAKYLYVDYKYKRLPKQCNDNVRDTVADILPNFLKVYVENLTNNKFKIKKTNFNKALYMHPSENIFIYPIRIELQEIK